MSEEAYVSAVAAAVIGTSAHLREGDSLSVRDLLFGLMLPSGNDAAIVLAEHFGPRLHLMYHQKTQEEMSPTLSRRYVDEINP